MPALNAEMIGSYDAGVICTVHTGVDYAVTVKAMDLVVDARHAIKGVRDRSNVILA